MLPVITRINQLKRVQAKHPFLEFLRDESVDPVERMAFAPCLAPLVMVFRDVNILGLRDESAGDDHLQSLVNEHTREDDHHWPMYLDDLVTLGHDVPTSPVETVRRLWGDHCTRTWRMAYGLMTFARTSSPRLRIALVEAVEATGFVNWRAFLRAADDYTAATGRTLRYFGAEHAALEGGHAMGADDIDRSLRDIDLGPERPRALGMTETVFALVADMLDEQLDYVRGA
jgi:hypothetical protein